VSAPSGAEPGRTVLRLRYTKLGKLRWLSHRDLARLFERALRRARLPVAYSTGFSPHPLLSFGLALPTGYESVAEYLDVRLSRTDLVVEAGPHLADLVRRELAPALPRGVEVQAAAVLEQAGPSLQQAVTACEWQLHLPDGDPARLRAQVAAVLAASELPVIRERRGVETREDLRPGVVALAVEDGPTALGRGPLVVAELATTPRGARPESLARVLGVQPALVRRTRQWMDVDGSRREPLEAGPLALELEGAAR
jgi:radical SAM-linked protein